VLNRCKQTTDELQNGTTENGSCQNSTKVSV
jgi:hypothetical protein